MPWRGGASGLKNMFDPFCLFLEGGKTAFLEAWRGLGSMASALRHPYHSLLSFPWPFSIDTGNAWDLGVVTFRTTMESTAKSNNVYPLTTRFITFDAKEMIAIATDIKNIATCSFSIGIIQGVTRMNGAILRAHRPVRRVTESRSPLLRMMRILRRCFAVLESRSTSLPKYTSGTRKDGAQNIPGTSRVIPITKSNAVTHHHAAQSMAKSMTSASTRLCQEAGIQ